MFMNIGTSIDEIVLTILPKLKNGQQPRKQRIIEEIKKIASPQAGKYWVLRADPQHVFDFAATDTPALKLQNEMPRKSEEEYEHNEILYLLTVLGRSAGFQVYIGKKEQSAEWQGKYLAELSAKSLPFLRSAEPFTKDKVTQIDVLWLDAKRVILAFEVEHSTAITSGLDRFIELLKMDSSVAERLVIVAPQSRERKMNQVLGSSHYIGAPMYMDTKVRYMWYSDVLKIVSQFSSQQPTKSTLAEAVTLALRIPKAKLV